MNKRVLVTICGRAGSKGFKNKNLKIFCGRPLVHYTLSAIELFINSRPDLDVDIAINTDSGLLKDIVIDLYSEVEYVQRPLQLAGDTVPKMAVFQHTMHTMEARKRKPYDYVIDLDITSPLRTAQDVLACFETKENRPDLDLVMSVTKSRRSPYMNMAQRDGDHVEQVIKTRFVARQQTPTCYDLNASIYVFERNFLVNNTSGYLWDGKCDVFEMMDTGILDIDSEEDFVLMEVIAKHLYQTYPDFAKIKDNIR